MMQDQLSDKTPTPVTLTTHGHPSLIDGRHPGGHRRRRRGGGGAAAPAGPAGGAAGFTVNGGAVELTRDSPQWSYIDLATAPERAAAPGAGAGAGRRRRVARRAGLAPLAGRVETVAVQLGQQVRGRRAAGGGALRGGARAAARRGQHAREHGGEDGGRAGEGLVALHAVPEKELELAERSGARPSWPCEAAQGKLKSLRVGEADDGGCSGSRRRAAGMVVERRALVGTGGRPRPQRAAAGRWPICTRWWSSPTCWRRDAGGLSRADGARHVAALPPEGLAGKLVHVATVVDPVRRTVAVRMP